jgi:hypothetical protein
MGLLFAAVICIVVVNSLFRIPETLQVITKLGIALLPAFLWIVFSWRREYQAVLPRQRLFEIAVLNGLAANALALPFIDNVLQINQWLPLQSAVNRILGYTFTVGIVQAITIYLSMRYTIWPAGIRIRLDSVAYAAASVVGYVTVMNVRFALEQPALVDVAAMQVFNHTAILMCTGIIVSYGLAEVASNRQPFPLLMAATLALASFITGIAFPLIAGLTSAGLSVLAPVGAISPLRGFLFSAGLLFAVANVFSFLFNVSDRQGYASSPEP